MQTFFFQYVGTILHGHSTNSQFLTVDRVGFQALNIETPSNNDASPPQPDASQISEESDAPSDPAFASSQLPQKQDVEKDSVKLKI